MLVDQPPRVDTEPQSYLDRWRHLSRPARLYLLHAALLTSSLAIAGLFFKLAILAMGYSPEFLGLLTPLALVVATVLSLPLWWLATRIGLWWSLLTSAALQGLSMFVFALWPATAPLLVGVGLTGVAAVLFQVSAPPFMMRHSDPATRDHLFSADRAINIGVAGLGSLLAGPMPGLFGWLLGVGAESAPAYRMTFAVAGVGLVLSLVPLLLITDRGGAKNQEQRTKNKESEGERERGGEGEITQHATRNTQHDERIESRFSRFTLHASRFTLHASRFTLHGLVKRIPEPWRGLVRRPGPLLRLLVSPFLISWGAALLILYLDLFFKQRFAVDNSVLGLIFAALGVTTGLSALVGPLISTRIGKIRTVVLTQALSLPFLLLLGFVPVLGVAIGAALARGALFNMGVPLYDAYAMEQTEEQARPTVIGLINGANTAGYLVAPAISTWVQARYGFGPLFIATAICYALAALANYWFFARGDGGGVKRET